MRYHLRLKTVPAKTHSAVLAGAAEKEEMHLEIVQ
jgi:hypothetical protein